MFDRETTENFELGAKTSWLDRKLTLNLTFYRMDISGFQDRAFDGTSFTVRNAGNLRHQGFEFDGVVSRCATCRCSPASPISIPSSPIIRMQQACPAWRNAGPRGKAATFAPEWSGRVGFDWTGDFGSGYSWGLNSNLSFVSKQFGGLVNDANPQTINDGYALLGARATLNGPAIAGRSRCSATT